MRRRRRFFAFLAAGGFLFLACPRNSCAVYLTQEQSYTGNAPGYWQGLFYEYSFATTTLSPVQYQRATISAPWLHYDSWFGLFLYDFGTGRFEEGFYYFDERL